MVSKYRDQSGGGVSDSVPQATFQAGIQDQSTRGHLALHGRLDTFQKMVVEVQAIERKRLGGSYLGPMDPLTGRGKAKVANGKGTESKGKERTKSGRRPWDF